MEGLIQRARGARDAAYAPYPGHAVGAALLTQDGSVYTGCNVEVSNLSNTVHTEEAAVSEAVREGHRDFETVAVSSEDGAAPCGMYRQTLAELCGGGTAVVVDPLREGETNGYSLSEPYPHAFDLAPDGPSV
jgi:cytidine deaminase